MRPLLVQAIDDKCDEERIGEGMERVWGPLPLECTAEFGAHAPVCSFVVRPVLDVDLLEAVNRDVVGDAAPAKNFSLQYFRGRPSPRRRQEGNHRALGCTDELFVTASTPW